VLEDFTIHDPRRCLGGWPAIGGASLAVIGKRCGNSRHPLLRTAAGRNPIDNERGKGDHRHHEGREERYSFSTVETLIADFLSDVKRVRGES